MSGVEAALENLKANRDLMEAFARDIKRSSAPDEPAYRLAESKYNAARSAFDGYFSALKYSILSGEPAGSVAGAAQNASAAATDFLAAATQQLDPTLSPRKIRFSKAFVLPTQVPAGLGAVPAKMKQQALASIADQVSWLPWTEI